MPRARPAPRRTRAPRFPKPPGSGSPTCSPTGPRPRRRRGAAPDLTELIPQWLATANRMGYRAPASLLPPLLDAARARTDLRPQALAFAGPRGLWLA